MLNFGKIICYTIKNIEGNGCSKCFNRLRINKINIVTQKSESE